MLTNIAAASSEVFDVKLGDYKLNFDEPLGGGTFGQVYRARHVNGGPVVALKRIRWHVDTSLLPVNTRQEVDSYKAVPAHDNIVKLFDHDISERYTYKVLFK